MASARLNHYSLVSILVLWILAGCASAQTQIDAGEIYLGTASCRISSGSGSPEASVTAPVCSLYLRTSDGILWRKATGTGNTGWVVVGAIDDPLLVGDGGTGRTTLTSNGVLYGLGTSAVGMTSQGAANSVLTANAGAPSFSATPTVTSLTATSSVGAATVTGSTSVTTPILASSGDITLNPTGLDVLPTSNNLINMGSLTAKYLTIHGAELWVQTLVAQSTIATIGGRVLVVPTTTLAADLAGGGTTISVKHNQIANGDRLFFEANGAFEAMAVTSGSSGSGPYTYSVTRNLDGSGANDWPGGAAVANTGTTGDGFIDMYSVAGVLPGSTAGPTIVGNVRTGTTYSNIEPRWAIGNLNGLFGYATDTYGAAFGTPSAAWVKIDPTNGVRIGHNATTNIQLDASGNATFSGAVTSTSGTIGGLTLASGSMTATNLGLYSGAANTARLEAGTGSNAAGVNSCNGSSDIGLWAGAAHSSRASAPFRVTCGGALTSTSATITGPSIQLGEPSTGYLSSASLLFQRATGGGTGWGASGDLFGVYTITAAPGSPWTSCGTCQTVAIRNEIRGSTGGSALTGVADTYLSAEGWNTGSGGIPGGKTYIWLRGYGAAPSSASTVIYAASPTADTAAALSVESNGAMTLNLDSDVSATDGYELTTTFSTAGIDPGATNIFHLGTSTNRLASVRSETYYSGATQGHTDTCAVNTFTISDGLVTACTSTSDPRLKMNIRPSAPGLNAVRSLLPITFNYKPTAFPDTDPSQDIVTREYTGFNAEELLSEIPNSVNYDQRGYLSIRDTMPIMAALVNAVKELAAEVEALKAQLAEAR